MRLNPDQLAAARRTSFPGATRILAVVFTLSASSCDEQAPSFHAPPLSRHIILIGEGKDEPTWPVLLGAGTAFARNYPRTTVEVIAPDTASPTAQQVMLRACLSSRADVVCIVPTETRALHAAISELAQAGKPVVTITRDASESKRGAYAGPNQQELGRAAARACPPALGGRARSIMLLFAGLEDEATGIRYVGFKQESEHIAGLQVLREIDCKSDLIEAPRLVRAEAQKYPRVGGWVFLDDWPLRTIPPRERLLPVGCGIILCSASPRYFDAVRDGRIRALIAFDVREAVDEALYAGMRLCDPKRKTAIERRDLAVETITAQNLPAYERRWKAWQLGLTTVEVEHASTTSLRPAVPE